jgi:hypothetical protein
MLVGGFDGSGAFLWVPQTDQLLSFGAGSDSAAQALDSDEGNNAFVGGRVAGRVTLPSVLGGSTFGDDGSGTNGFFMRIPSSAPERAEARSVGDGTAATPGDQLVSSVAVRGDLLALCGTFERQIAEGIAPATAPNTQATEVFVARFDYATGTSWTDVLSGSSAEFCNGVGIDADGNVYASVDYGNAVVLALASGDITLASSSTGTDSLIVALDAVGNHRWHVPLALNAAGEQSITDLFVDVAGNVYAVGFTNTDFLLPRETGVPTGIDPNWAFVLSLDRNGIYRWTQRVAVDNVVVANFVRLWAVDVLDRSSSTRAIAVAGEISGSLMIPSGQSLTGTSAGLVLVFTE